MKIGGTLGGRAAEAVFSKDLVAFTKRVASKVGVKTLQRTIVKYVVPLASIGRRQNRDPPLQKAGLDLRVGYRPIASFARSPMPSSPSSGTR